MGLLNRLQGGPPTAPPSDPSICVILKNMFDPNGEDERNDKDFFHDLKEDIKEECSKHGSVRDAEIDRKSNGCVYMKFDDVDAATRCVSSLNGRWFAGKQINADFVAEDKFDDLRM